MAKKIGLLFAGQGAQTVGMGKDLADEFPVAAEMFTSADAILARKLTDVTWKGPIEELTKTSNCQPALFVHGVACFLFTESPASRCCAKSPEISRLTRQPVCLSGK